MTGDELRAARRWLGLSASQMETALGFAKMRGRHLRRMETGSRDITPETEAKVHTLLKDAAKSPQKPVGARS